MPKIKILNLPKYVLGGPDDCQEGYVWDESLQQCVVDYGYNPSQENQKNQPAIPVVNQSGQTVGGPASTGKTGPGTGVNPSYTVAAKDCPPGYVKNQKGQCVVKKTGVEKWADTLGTAKVFGSALAQEKTNREREDAYKKMERNKAFTGQMRNPGRQYTMGNIETQSGVQFPGSMTPPNEGMFSNAFYNPTYPIVEFGGAFGGGKMFDSLRPIRIKILEAPEMKYGGQFEGSYGLDVGWRNLYTDMSKTDADHYGETLSEDKKTNQPPVLEAEDGETLYKVGDGELYKLSGDTHANGGIELTEEQVSSKNSDVPSFIFSNTNKMKIKDKNILDHFGVTYKKGGVTPANISKKYDLNKYKAILDDPNKDPLAKATAQMMLEKNEERLAELAAIQEEMKGVQPPSFVQQKLGQVKYGGFLKKVRRFDDGGPTGPGDDWIKKILQFESTKGSSSGTGLANYGIKKSDWESKYPDIWKDNKVDEQEAIDFIKAEYLPKVKDYPEAIQKRLVDYAFNTGRSIEDLLLYADGRITLDDINSANTFTPQWSSAKKDIEKKLSDPAFITKLDDAKLNVYKTTKPVGGKPNPAFSASWEPRVNMWNDPVTSTSAAGTPSATKTSSGKPPVGLGEWTDDYEKLESTLMDDRNKELRKELFDRYKKQYPKTPVSEEQYIQNLLNAQKQNFAIRAAYGDDKYLQDEDWDKGGKKRNNRYKKEVEALGFTPLTDDEIIRFQAGYQDLEKAMREPKFFETFGKYFRTKQFGKADEPDFLGKKTISKPDKIYGNTTAGEVFELSGWKDPEPVVDTTTTAPPQQVSEPRYVCISDGKGGGEVKQLPLGMTGGYSSPEEAAKNCPGPMELPPNDYLLPDKVNMLSKAAIFPEVIFPMIPQMASTPTGLSLEDWRAPAATAFSVQYAAPAEQLSQYTSPQALTANLSALAGQAAQNITGQIMPGVIGRNVDRVNAYSQAEGKRQDEINMFNLLQRQKGYEGWATARQQYQNALRGYLKENSDAFTRAWNNRMQLGLINATNNKFYLNPTSGAATFYNPNRSGIAGLPSGSATADNVGLGSAFNAYYTKALDEMKDVNLTDEKKKQAAYDLAMASVKANRFTETSSQSLDGSSSRVSRRKTGFDFN
jgi:hypothetical protein